MSALAETEVTSVAGMAALVAEIIRKELDIHHRMERIEEQLREIGAWQNLDVTAPPKLVRIK